MNTAVYLFGRLGGDYTQYPDDHTRQIFTEFEGNMKAASQMMIRRSGELIYYGYLRRIASQGRYIGIAFVFNGVACSDVQTLCRLCEENITQWVVSGNVLEFADNGDLISEVGQLYRVATEFERIADSLKAQLDIANLPFDRLPPVNLSVSKGSIKEIDFHDGNEAFLTALSDYSNIYIVNAKTSHSLASLSAKLLRMSTCIENLKKEVEEWKRKKKNSDTVQLLAILLIIVNLFFFFFYNTQENQIKKLKNQISIRDNHIESLRNDTIFLHNRNQALNQKIDEQFSWITQLRQDSTRLEAQKNGLANELNWTKKDISNYKRLVRRRD